MAMRPRYERVLLKVSGGGAAVTETETMARTVFCARPYGQFMGITRADGIKWPRQYLTKRFCRSMPVGTPVTSALGAKQTFVRGTS
jgi:hypothetical protein